MRKSHGKETLKTDPNNKSFYCQDSVEEHVIAT